MVIVITICWENISCWFSLYSAFYQLLFIYSLFRSNVLINQMSVQLPEQMKANFFLMALLEMLTCKCKLIETKIWAWFDFELWRKQPSVNTKVNRVSLVGCQRLTSINCSKVAFIRTSVIRTELTATCAHIWLSLQNKHSCHVFCYLWLFLTHKCCIYGTFWYMWWHLRYFLCVVFFFMIFLFQMNIWQIIFHQKPCAFIRICIILYGLTAILLLLHLGKRVPLQTDLYRLDTHSSRPYCIYVRVLYDMSPINSVFIQQRSRNVTDDRPAPAEWRSASLRLLKLFHTLHTRQLTFITVSYMHTWHNAIMMLNVVRLSWQQVTNQVSKTWPQNSICEQKWGETDYFWAHIWSVCCWCSLPARWELKTKEDHTDTWCWVAMMDVV